MKQAILADTLVFCLKNILKVSLYSGLYMFVVYTSIVALTKLGLLPLEVIQ